MNKLTIFKYEQKEVRTTNVNGEPYFCLADVCRILGIGNPSDVVKRLKRSGVVSVDHDLINGLSGNINTKANYINESNLYKCIMTSRKKEAEKFQDWVTEEVLPSIRKEGTYGVPTDPRKLIASALIEAHKIIEENVHKVEFYDFVANTKELLSVSEFGKVIGFGSITLFRLLRDKKVFYIDKTQNYNLVYQEYIKRGYFKVRESKLSIGDKDKIYLRIFLTGKGQSWLIKKMEEWGVIESESDIRNLLENYHLSNKNKLGIAN